MLRLEYQVYAACLSRFFGIQLLAGETIATDGKVLRGSYEAISDDPEVDSHPAIMLVSAYLVERGLILALYEVESKTEVSTETRYYIASFIDTAQAFAERIRGYWGVENKVHYVRDVTQGEDASRIRTSPLVQI